MKDIHRRQSTSSSEKSEKRQKDQMSITVFGIVVYSVVLVLIIAGSFIGFKAVFNSLAARKAAAEAELLEQERLRQEEEAEELRKKEQQEELKKAAEAEQAEETDDDADDNEYADTVFSVIENVHDPKNAPVNTFDFMRKVAGSENDKTLDYCIYTNPETKAVEKISTREDCGDLFEITDYYYDNGVINYIAQYKVDVDTPVDLSGAEIESRCYYHNDKMIRYIYCENGKATEYSKADFSSYSEGTQGQYDYIGDMMLELSKNVYKNAEALDERVKISGYVLDEYNQVLQDNYVALIDDMGRTAYETATNGDGYYEFIVPASDYREYTVRAVRDTMLETNIYGIKAARGSKAVFVDTFYLCYDQSDDVYPVQIFVKNAEDFTEPLSDAQIRLRYGINNKSGDCFMTGTLGIAGECVPQLRSGSYTAEITKDGYETCYASFVVKPDKIAAIFYAVKELSDDEFKCVLSFDTTPLDLDLRAYNSYGRTLFKSDTDSVGGTSAELIDIKDAGADTYSVYVSNYADIMAPDNFSYRLSRSNAKLSVYDSNGLMGVYPVPEVHAGILWKPLEIRNGKIMAVNDFYTNVSDKSDFRLK